MIRAGNSSARINDMKKTFEEIIERLPFRGRGIEKFTVKVGNISEIIEKNLHRNQRILEIGTGYAQLLVELASTYGDSLELHGFNKEGNYVNFPTALKIALYRKKITDINSINANQITFNFGDAGTHLPYPDEYFDLIVSQYCIAYIPDKLNLLNEISRILKKDGKAILHTEFEHVIHEEVGEDDDFITLEIYRQNTPVRLEDYFAAFPNLEYILKQSGSILKIDGGARNRFDGSIIKVEKIVHDQFFGVRSIYSLD
jgi:ubiquinone/menaquinone biosynthesis C-methylase UbiE